MTVITRFAPSPTGRLHVGNIRTALHNWLWARKQGGRFLLRLDDTDSERSKEEHVEAIRADLAWLGMDVDGEERQSARFDRYDAAFERLRAAGRVYACYETPQELELKRKILLGRGKPPVYDRAALDLTDRQIADHEAEGRTPHWRFKLDHDTPIAWDDLIRGPQHFDPALLSDPVIRREDGSWLYMLPSAVDDAEMGITHVVRGEDHVTNTGLQLQMFDAMNALPPAFAHEALLVGSEGKLSKRLGSLGVETFREDGIEPMAVVSLLARIGTSDPVEPFTEAAPLIESFDFARFGRAPARFDGEELQTLNAKILHQLDYDAVAARLPQGMGADGWQAIRPNLTTLSEASDWWHVVEGPVDSVAIDAETEAFLDQAAEIAATLDWSDAAWKRLTGELKEKSGRKGKALFLPLRQALTGRDHGPEMASLLPLIGKDRAIARLARRL
ncbi:glutamate--tRNA ligase [Parasphingopyxis lamellibrachiae]|uniref:Glutamate--tRNA ligase n=1 Tax=Parasphingopyxis lamellibrachiae TaxID=680125 RepID=A0A3D9FH85_9SPHN|nr:glutamate--tRNA ligase [Parasphingopyxis lamellibrachiae]RED17143.1 glutamyl-tRNA synthetase [Parasphingopyxis lamellibrachiae]